MIAGRIDEAGRCKVPLEGRAVQEGVYYSSKLEFMAFDVAYCWSGGGSEGDARHLRFLTSSAFERLGSALRTASDFRFARTLLRTRNYREVLDFDLEFATTIVEAGVVRVAEGRAADGASRGRVQGASGKRSKAKTAANAKAARNEAWGDGFWNVAEGIVARSDVVLNQPALDAGAAFAPLRWLIKRKNVRFAEIQDLETSYTASDAAKSYAFAFAKMVTVQRLNGVLSKTFGRITAENAEEVVAALAADVWEDFYASAAGAACVIADQGAAEEHLLRLCRECVGLAGVDG